MADEKLVAKFVFMQSQLKATLSKVPPSINKWSYQRAVEFKKAAKESERFLALKPTDDSKQIHRIENQLHKVQQFYGVQSW